MNAHIDIEVKDCYPFPCQDVPGFEQAIRQLIHVADESAIFRFSDAYTSSEDDYVVDYNYKERRWMAGRYVGEAIIPTAHGLFHFRITPRFGRLFLFRMIEEVFNIQIRESKSDVETDKDYNTVIMRIISFIWLKKLAEANKHGLPRINITRDHLGFMLKGRINVRKTILPYFSSNNVVSTFMEKHSDKTIMSILYQAFQILKKDYGLGKLNFPNNAQDAINHIESAKISNEYISTYAYHAIKYKSIYQSYKSVVDFSWDIIKRKRLSTQTVASDKDGYAFFIDMAELWERYLNSILIKNMRKHGWTSANDKWLAYENRFFQRHLIPDIVLEKGNDVMVWDAKYKRMRCRGNDIDRGDFFQIHTYLQYYLNQKNVHAGGLLYPMEHSYSTDERYSDALLSQDGVNTTFCIDGINYSFLDDWKGSNKQATEHFVREENNFISRITKLAE